MLYCNKSAPRTVTFFGLAFYLALIMCVILDGAGCQARHEDKSILKAVAERHKYLNDDELFRRIDEISVGHLRRGMTKEALKANLGNKLIFRDTERTAICILTRTRSNDDFDQAPSAWIIKFFIDDADILTDFYLTRPEGK